MMQRNLVLIAAASLLHAATGLAGEASLDLMMQRSELTSAVQRASEGALIEESTALEQAKVRARSRSDYALELRPSISDNDAGLALRIYLPDHWSKKRLQEQLGLAARSEQLRIAALEWPEVMEVYRTFCDYRLFHRQLKLFDAELETLEPRLAEADQWVEMNQMAVVDRARLYGIALEWTNTRNKLADDLADVERQLHLLLGPSADLKRLSAAATVAMPSQLELESQLLRALQNRTDYRLLDTQAQAMGLAAEAARTEDGFRLKYLQPTYRVDHGTGESGWELSAAFVLPWGTRNPDIAVYRNEELLMREAMRQQRQLIEDRLRVLLGSAERWYERLAERNHRVQPLLDRLASDLETLGDVPLEQLRDVLAIRERILEVRLQDAETQGKMEQLAVDLAEELGHR